jgi:hypothetical protein
MAPLDENLTLFHYRPELGLPIYLAVRLGDFESNLTGLLTSLGFSIAPSMDDQSLDKELASHPHARILKIELAGARVAAQIRGMQESDRYGKESLLPHQGYKVYRLKDRCLMMFSFGAEVWRAGVFQDFGSANEAIKEEHRVADRLILGRYLSWALSSFGIVGLFGKVEDGSIRLLKPRESRGQMLFVDWRNERILTETGIVPIGANADIIRFDSALKKGQRRQMRAEQLLSALSAHTTYLSYDGPSAPVRQVFQSMATTLPGFDTSLREAEISLS